MIHPTANQAGDAAPWHQRRWILYLSLALLYPLGVVLLVKNPRVKTWRKAVGAVVFAPIFAALVLVALLPFWEFRGGMSSLWDFSLDFGRLTHDGALAQHRAAQKTLHSNSPSFAGKDCKESWPEFRGHRRDGIYDQSDFEFDWKKHPPREIWRQPVGGGYATFVVGGCRAYTIEQRRKNEAIVCYHYETGREIWAYEYNASFEETLGGDGPRATPTLAGRRLYVLGAQGHLHCLDSETGKVLWQHSILQEYDQENLSWGLAGSPLVIDGKVLVTNSGKPGPSILAFDSESGQLVWKRDAGAQAYTSLVTMTLAGRRQVLNLAADALNAIDPATGEILWSFPWTTQWGINCSQPLDAGKDRVFISAGYGKGCALIQIESISGKLQTRELWFTTKMKNKFNSSVVHGGFVYGLDEGVLCCLDLATGDRRWKGGRYGYGSLILAQGHLIVMSEQGQLAVVEAKPDEYRELGSITVFDERTWNNFVPLGGRILARNHKEMVLYDLRPSARTQLSTSP